MLSIADVGSWREGGGRNIPAAAPTTDEDRTAYTPPSATAPTAASSEDEETTPQPPFHPQSQAAVMAHLMRPGMGPGPRMGPAGPMMYGPMMPPFVSDAEIPRHFFSNQFYFLFISYLLVLVKLCRVTMKSTMIRLSSC